MEASILKNWVQITTGDVVQSWQQQILSVQKSPSVKGFVFDLVKNMQSKLSTASKSNLANYMVLNSRIFKQDHLLINIEQINWIFGHATSEALYSLILRLAQPIEINQKRRMTLGLERLNSDNFNRLIMSLHPYHFF